MTGSQLQMLDELEREFERLEQEEARAKPRLVRLSRPAALIGVLLTLALGGGAVAVQSNGTGVPVLDELLRSLPGPEGTPDGGAGQGNQGDPPPERPDLRPGPGEASQPLKVPLDESGSQGQAVAYLTHNGEVCEALTAPRQEGDDVLRGSVGGCAPVDYLAERLDRSGVECCGVTGGANSQIVTGFAHRDVVAIRLYGPGGPVEAGLTEPWTPAATGAEPLRFFLAVVKRQADVGEDGVQPNELPTLTALPRIQAEFSDGHVAEVQP